VGRSATRTSNGNTDSEMNRNSELDAVNQRARTRSISAQIKRLCVSHCNLVRIQSTKFLALKL